LIRASERNEALNGINSKPLYRQLRHEALKARCSTAQGGGREAAETLG
jgi:hypothetical protein